jgi:hypothetical protein
MNASTHSRYLRQLGIVLGSMLAAVASFNFIIDPYGLWGAPVIERLNAGKPAERDNEMMFKAADVRRARPATLLLGSSRVDLGLDPLHPALAEFGPAYNLALMGGYVGPLLQYYKHALGAQPPPRRVVMGLDFFAFNRVVVAPPSFDAARLGLDHLILTDVVASLLTRVATVDSFRTVVTSWRDPLFRAFTQGMATDAFVHQYAVEKGMPERFRESTELYLNGPGYYEDFVLSEKAFADIAEIVRLSSEQGVDLRFFIPPEHIVLQEALRVRGLWETYWRWKERIAALSPYWDFSGYNTITTEPIGDRMSLYWDASHFRKGVGNLVLDRILGADNPGLPADFGRYIAVGDIARWRAQSENARQEWAATHGEVIRWVKDMAAAR